MRVAFVGVHRSVQRGGVGGDFRGRGGCCGRQLRSRNSVGRGANGAGLVAARRGDGLNRFRGTDGNGTQYFVDELVGVVQLVV